MSESLLASLAGGGVAGLSSGAYNDGIVTFLDTKVDTRSVASWDWLIGEDVVPVATTGLGNVFLWNAGAIYLLDTQFGEYEFIDRDVGWFLDSFLARTEVREEVLREKFFAQLLRRNRKLRYLETFVLEPWLVLGGEDRLENYSIGSVLTYINLLGQAHERKS